MTDFSGENLPAPEIHASGSDSEIPDWVLSPTVAPLCAEELTKFLGSQTLIQNLGLGVQEGFQRGL